MTEKTMLTLKDAQQMVEAMLEYATNVKPGRPVAVAVLDNAKILVSFAKMDGGTSNNETMAINKAWSCLHMGFDTRTIHDLPVKKSGHDLSYFTMPDRLTAIPGGLIIKNKDEIVLGAVGVSGRLADEDEEIAKAGVNALK